MQRVTHGRVAGIDHHSQEKVIQPCEEQEKTYLADVAFICYTFVLCLDVPQHILDGGRDETDVCKGQVGEEEVHRGVEVGI